MSRFTIYSKDGSSVRYNGTPKYNGNYMKPAYLEYREIASPTPINWEVGDYVIYTRTGLKYRLYSLPQPTRKASTNKSGESFVYSNVQFYADTKQLEVCPFIDLVPEDNQVHFSTRPEVSTYEDVAGIARRIQECLNFLYTNSVDASNNAWIVNVESFDTSDTEQKKIYDLIKDPRAFSVSGGSCLDALDQIYSVWPNIGWAHSYNATTGINTITIGASNKRTSANTTMTFAYGSGLTQLKKSISSSGEIATRLYVYGSSDNMITRYYNGVKYTNPVTGAQSYIADNEGVDIAHLMLPLSRWGYDASTGIRDAKKAYLEASSDIVSRLGLIPKTIYFDGTTYEKICPSIKGVTVGDVRTAKSDIGDTTYVPSSTIYPVSTERVDVLASANTPVDDGIKATDGKTYSQEFTSNVSSSTKRMEASVALGTVSTRINLASLTVPGTITATPSVTGTIVVEGAISHVLEMVVASGSVVSRQVVKTALVSGSTYSFSLPSAMLSQVTGSAVTVDVIVTCSYDSMDGKYISLNINEGTIKYRTKKVLPSTFTIVVKQMGFDITERASLGNGCTFNMTSGKCAGRSFKMKKSEYRRNTDDWLVTLVRCEDESLGMYFPNSTYPLATGDSFVLTDIAMPEIYINLASEKLRIYGMDVLNDMARIKPFYEPAINAKYVLGQQKAYPNDPSKVILEGKYMALQDADIIGANDEYVVIDSLTISEDESAIPTYRVSLRDEKMTTFHQATKEVVENTMIALIDERINDRNVEDGRYDSLEELPKINGVELKGDVDSNVDLGLVSSDGVKNIVICQEYPEVEESGTLYIKMGI